MRREKILRVGTVARGRLLWQERALVVGYCEAVYGAPQSGMANEEPKREQRETFPIINKAIAPSILMRQGEKNPVARPTVHNRIQWRPCFPFKSQE